MTSKYTYLLKVPHVDAVSHYSTMLQRLTDDAVLERKQGKDQRSVKLESSLADSINADHHQTTMST